MAEDALLVLSELVANAVLHGRPLPDGAIRVEWQPHDGVVDIAITDGGGVLVPHARPAPSLAPTGRGLGIVATMTRDWGVSRQPGESTVWAVVGPESR